MVGAGRFGVLKTIWPFSARRFFHRAEGPICD